MLTSPNHDLPFVGASNVNVRNAYNFRDFPKISIGTQNCNSLNISTTCDRQLKKVSAICSMDNDIILLCDLRLNADVDHIEKIKKQFLYNKSRQYNFFITPVKVVGA
jgi:hypothetical protein